ncbi:hypothetical protein T484DRAFT_1565415, partial [Baffinella frigidus]
CIVCPEDTFKLMTGDGPCTPCGPNSQRVLSGNQTRCACKPGAFEDSQGRCVLCVVGTFKDTTGGHACNTCTIKHSTKQIGSTDASDCKCAAGSYSTNVGQCEQCPVSIYSPF